MKNCGVRFGICEKVEPSHCGGSTTMTPHCGGSTSADILTNLAPRTSPHVPPGTEAR